MSGEVVAAPSGGGAALVGLVAVPIVLPLVAVGAAGVVAYGAGKAIKDLVDARVEAAVREMEAERARITEWQCFQAEQCRQNEAVRKQAETMREVERKLAGIKLSAPVEAAQAAGPAGLGYSSVTKSASPALPLKEMGKMLEQVARVLEETPNVFRDAPDSPFQRLRKNRERLSARLVSVTPPLLEEIDSFRNAVSSAINMYMEDQRLIAERQALHTKQLDAILSDIGLARSLADDTTTRSKLDRLQAGALKLLAKTLIMPGDIESLATKVQDIKTEVEQRLVNGAFRTTLADSLTRNLAEMGYEVAQAFPDAPHQSTMRAHLKIPGGERVRITINRDNSLAFRVMHEALSLDAIVSSVDRQHFRDQEQRWCGDLKQLIRRMIQEGFIYAIDYEDKAQKIEVVVVEDAAEILASQRQRRQEEEMRQQQNRQQQMKHGRVS